MSLLLKFHDEVALGRGKLDARGMLRVDHAPLARTGVQTYAKRELGLGATGSLRIWRDEKVVFDPASLSSWSNVPIVVGHGGGAITAANWKAEAAGQVIGDAKRHGSHVVGTIEVRDAAAIKLVRDGTAGLSASYSAKIEMQSGTSESGEEYDAVMKDVVIDSCALVAAPRCESCVIQIGDQAIMSEALKLVDGRCSDPKCGCNIQVRAEDAGLSSEAAYAGDPEVSNKARYNAYLASMGAGPRVTGSDDYTSRATDPARGAPNAADVPMSAEQAYTGYSNHIANEWRKPPPISPWAARKGIAGR